ncbi:unnamed protein product [Symbiodinium sp. CCMP2592]|nr:unnamed protein product [Symbiodinium sp. CCMP2592]
MASVADTAVTFASKARQYGLSQGVLDSLSAAGITTYSALLFAVASAPGAVDEVRLKAAKDKHLGPDATEGAVSAFSRLLFEAGTFVVAELRSSVAGEDDGSKKLTSQERTSRMDALRAKLGAWPITGSFEPSHVLIDAAFGMVADSSVRYLPPSKCSSREQEILSERRDDTLFRLEATALKAARKPVLPKVDLGNELRLYQALSRRGVALEVAGVCSFSVHENYVRGLLDHLQRMPPPGYSAPGIDAVLAADRAVWQQVAAQVPCLPAVDVAAKVDAALLTAAGAPAVAFHVMPREKKRALDDPTKPPGKTGKGDGKDNRPGKGKEKGGRGKGGKTPGGGKPGSPAKQTAVPAALKGLDPNKDGTPLCFDRNLAHGCKRETWQTPAGLQCEKGLHLCMKCGSPDHGAHVSVPSVDCILEAQATASAEFIKSLSKCLKASGFETVAVDVKDAAGHQVLKLDLLSASGLAVLWEVLNSGQVLYVHMAPPCSTASAARFIPGGPRPLRDAAHPDGLPGLSFSQRFQVHNANRLYGLCRDVALFCQSRQIGWSIENPSSSLFWLASPMVSLCKHLGSDLCTVVFDHCCWGGDRPKRTALWSNLRCLGSLEAMCSPSLGHVHKPWGRLSDGTWSTKAEAAYPLPLCRFWAHLLQKHWGSELSARLAPSAVNWSGPACLFETRRALGLFPRGRHPGELHNPFSDKIQVRLPLSTAVHLLVPGSVAQIAGAPKGCKVLSCVKEAASWLVEVGVPCEPEAFMQSAASFRHPSECDVELPADLEETLSAVSRMSCAELARRRCRFLHSILQRSHELSTREAALHSGLEPHAKTVLKGKRLLLLEELLSSLGHEDTRLVADICSGFKLTGWLAPSGVMEPKITAPSESAANLWRQRSDLNAKAWNQTTPTASAELDRSLWDATVKDASSGWAMLLPSSAEPPTEVLLSRRFAVVQGDKVRGVDDFSFNGLNDTLGTCEKVTTMSTAHTVALGLRLLRIAKARGMSLLGRCFDLKSAYRQLPIHLDDLPYAAVTVWSPEDNAVRVLQMFALPFGAGGSVPGFVRVSLALWRILCRLALVPATMFFDDYTCIVLESDAVNAEASVHMLFRMLGWRLALEGDKAVSFAQAFQSLGVVFLLTPGVDCSLTVGGSLIISPKVIPRYGRLPLFTDGAFENGTASIGGVLCDGWCQPLQWFGCDVPSVVTGGSGLLGQRLLKFLGILTHSGPMAWALALCGEVFSPQPALGVWHFFFSEPTDFFLEPAKGFGWSSQEERTKRVQALCKWSNLLKLAPEFFCLATVERLPTEGDESVVEHLDVLFSKKSTNALLTRASPLTRFVLWRRRTCPEDVTSESVVWLHCRWLQGVAAASSIDSFVSSLNFVHGTLGLRVSVQELLSARVRGLAHAHLRTKEEVAQATALTVVQLRWLEYYAATADDLYERLVASTLCFMVFARARRSDVARATHIEFDLYPDGMDGFVECRVKNPKQARASSKRNLFMPLTALFCGVSDVPWGATFLAVREANRLESNGALDHPLLPGLTAAGLWLQECVSSSQLTQWLRCILAKAPDADLSAIAAVVSSVKRGKFAPDVTRSGRWQEPGSPASSASASLVSSPPSSAERKSSAAAASAAAAAVTSSSSGSSEASCDSDDGADQLVAAAPHFVENILGLGGYAVAGNKKNKLLHIVKQKTGRLLCGRLLSDSFEVSSATDAGDSRFCRTCKTCALACV